MYLLRKLILFSNILHYISLIFIARSKTLGTVVVTTTDFPNEINTQTREYSMSQNGQN